MTLFSVIDHVFVARAIRAGADVVEVDDENGLVASVYLAPGRMAVARLDRSLDGSPDEGRVLREVMYTTTGIYGPGLFLWYEEEGGGVRHQR